jgi:hypothetical protein
MVEELGPDHYAAGLPKENNASDRHVDALLKKAMLVFLLLLLVVQNKKTTPASSLVILKTSLL